MMSKKSPQLRFEGFTDDWEERKLGDISYKVKEKNKTGEFTETLTNSAEYGIINQRDFFDKDISNAKNLTGYYVVKNDDFVYNPRISNFAPVGPIKRNKLGRTGVMSPLYYVFRTHDIDKNYFEKYFDTVYWHRFMELNGDSGARADRFAIKDSVFVEMPIPYPTMDEQQKIGSFFKQLDDTIALHQRKLDLLKEQKKGYLQKMFPKNGAKVPELRFAGFAEDWEERKLGEVGKTKSGIGFPDAQQGGKQGTPFYKVSDMNNPGNEVVMMNANNYASDSQLKENKWNPINPQNSGVVFAKVGAAIFLDRKRIVDTSFLIDNNMMSYLFDSSWNRYFGKTLFEKLRLSRFAQVGALPSFNGSDVEDIKVMIPKESEQKMIGDMFEKLDDTIALHQLNLDFLKEQKKGFLQKMFI